MSADVPDPPTEESTDLAIREPKADPAGPGVVTNMANWAAEKLARFIESQILRIAAIETALAAERFAYEQARALLARYLLIYPRRTLVVDEIEYVGHADGAGLRRNKIKRPGRGPGAAP